MCQVIKNWAMNISSLTNSQSVRTLFKPEHTLASALLCWSFSLEVPPPSVPMLIPLLGSGLFWTIPPSMKPSMISLSETPLGHTHKHLPYLPRSFLLPWFCFSGRNHYHHCPIMYICLLPLFSPLGCKVQNLSSDSFWLTGTSSEPWTVYVIYRRCSINICLINEKLKVK